MKLKLILSALCLTFITSTAAAQEASCCKDKTATPKKECVSCKADSAGIKAKGSCCKKKGSCGKAEAQCGKAVKPRFKGMNPVLESLKTRRAVRTYSGSMPEKCKLQKVLEAGTYAPTGMGRQSPVIVAITNKEVRDRVAKLNAGVMGRDGDPFYGAPVVLVVLADKSVPTYLYDGSLVMGNLLNAAHAVGLSSCWIHRAKEVFDTAEGKALLKEWGIEGDYEGIGNCIIGYNSQDKDPQPAPRKADYVHYVE